MNWLRYLLEANLYLSIFYGCYCLFLIRETHYTLNRFFLLFSCVISLILPLIQIGILKPAEPTVQNTFGVIVGNVHPNTIPAQIAPAVSHFNLQDSLLYTYLLGFVILLVILALKLYQLLKLTRTKSAITRDGYKLIHINDSNTAFSFFNYLFIGDKAHGSETIIRHELIHIRQKHSFDIVLLEIFKVINWFNPLVYLLQNSLKTVHEYIADEKTASFETDALSYSTFLVNNAYGLSGSSIAHSFFNYNLLKKRIIMLNQKRSGRLARLKYLLILPVCAGLLCVSTLSFSKTYGWVDLAPRYNSKDTTNIVIRDPYVNARSFKIQEKGYKVGDVTYFSATITDKDGHAFTIYKGHGNASGEAMIYNNYGYKFPDVEATEVQGPPPPPPPMFSNDTTFNALTIHAQEALKYPEKARKNNITGNVIARFDVDKDNKIITVKIIRGLGYGCDEQVTAMLNSYAGTIKGKFNSYLVDISFYLFIRSKENPVVGNHFEEKTISAPNCALGVGVTAFGE